MAKTYSLFISHSWDHDDTLQSLKNLLMVEAISLLIIRRLKKIALLIQRKLQLSKPILLNVCKSLMYYWL